MRLGESDPFRDPYGGDFAETAEINVTPFVDIMLVLLIVFMIAAPLATVAVQVELPPASAEPAPAPARAVYVSIQQTGQVFVMEEQVSFATLIERIDARTGGVKTDPIYLRADANVPYRSVMRAINALQDGGYLKLSLVGEDIIEDSE
ncbi:MAG: hypothetical protein GC199_09320 [Alphaproteobacteria bacterium]|nr:hypothetical protein [Alphaproteobacteria bacterium]